MRVCIYIYLSGIFSVSVCAHCLLCFHWAPLSLFHTLINKISLSLLPALSAFHCIKILQSLSHLCGPLLGSLQYVHVRLVLGSPEQDPALRMGLISAEQRGRITSLDLLAILLLMQPKMLLAAFCCKGVLLAHVNLVSTASSSAKLLSSQAVRSLYWCMALFLPRGRTWHFPLSFVRFLLACFLSLLRSV